MNINYIKFLYLTFFCIFVLFDYLVRTNVFGENFKLYYLKFISSNILLVSFTFFVIIYAIFYITGAFDFLPNMVVNINSINNAPQDAQHPASVVTLQVKGAEHAQQGLRRKDASSLYPNYPLNLLQDINTLVNSELLIVVILINMFVVQYILTQDYTKYIPDNKFGRFVNFFLSRYIKVYSQSNKFIIGFCVLNLIVCIFFSKLFLYFIMNPS